MWKTGKITLEDLPKRSIKGLSGKIEAALNGATNGTFDGLQVTSTACHYGGSRYWWVCPDCGRRVGCLYWLVGKYRCRHCVGGVHASSQRGRFGRALWTAYNLLARYDPKPRPYLHEMHDFLNPLLKPKGMHWARWSAIVKKQHRAAFDVCTMLQRKWEWISRGSMSPDEVRAAIDRINAAQKQKP